MSDKRKFSIFISSTYEDLKEERQGAMWVALENDLIPVGMEQFHAAPVEQWKIITKMMDECDFYLLIVGGCYGSIEESVGISYTEKEYNYAKEQNMPVYALIRNKDGITEAEMDREERWPKQERLENFRNKIMNGGNTVDFYDSIEDLKYKLATSFNNKKNFVANDAGWVRYKDVQNFINERINKANTYTVEEVKKHNDILTEIQNILHNIDEKLQETRTNQLTWEDISEVTKADIDELFS